ncbi:MAG: hypothetical protein AB7V42_01055 [Thermoleophilia bacterium]
MPSPSERGAEPRRVLVIANETCAAKGVADEVAYRAGAGGEVLVVAPALAKNRIDHWLSADMENRRQDALARLEASLATLTEAGLSARGHLGDGDPLQALDDALRIYNPDEVVISTHPPQRSNWLERQVVAKARERYDVPITHIVVDIEHGDGATARVGSTDSAPADVAERRLRLFHESDYDGALSIRAGGFRDAPAGDRAGVLVTERPPAGRTDDRVLFVVDVPAEAVAPFEHDAGDDGRRFLLPADMLNRQGPPISVDEWSE